MNCRHETSRNPSQRSAPSLRMVVGRRCAECTEESEEMDADDGRCTSEAWFSVSHVIADRHTPAAHERLNTKAQSAEAVAATAERHVLTQPSCTSSHGGFVGGVARLVQAVAVTSFPTLARAAPSLPWKRDVGDSKLIVSQPTVDQHAPAAYERLNAKARNLEALASAGEHHALTQPSCSTSYGGLVGELGRFGRVSCRFVQAVAVFSFPTIVRAAPSPYWKRDSGDSRIIAPVVIVAVFLVAAAILTIVRRGWHGNMARWTSNAANSFGPSTGADSTTRELTAQQLAGGMSATANGDAAPRTRRTRRPGRRASQMSTRSLPVYMKEPGDQEVVIYRGPEDMEDSPLPPAAIMPSVAESATESPDLSLNMSRIESRDAYGEMPDSPHDMPLLTPDDSPATTDNSEARLLPPHQASARPSMDTLAHTDESGSALMHSLAGTPDPRGEAPPYFEVVALGDLRPSPALSSDPGHDEPPSPEIPAPAPAHQESTRRRTGLLGLFHSRTRSAAQPTTANAEASSSANHRREDSNATNASSAISDRRRSRAHSRAGNHRPSQSGSGSMFSAMSRSRSRLLDSPHLNSPSTLSVNSISSPLTHTLVRTEFTYPKSGPTPEQIKLIASRESFARFGLPYGQDAIAFAASTSRMDLPSHPPPEFEEVAPSRSQSRIDAETTLVDEGTSADLSTSATADETAVEEEHSHEQEASSTGHTLLDVPEETSGASEPSPPPPIMTRKGKAVADKTESLRGKSPPPGLEADSTAPSAFKLASLSALPPRAESRASSFVSFETAEESLSSPPATPFASVSSKLTVPKVQISTASEDGTATPPSQSSELSTPRIKPSHVHEDTDTTITHTPSTPTTPSTEIGTAL